jgi:hypothetical protein
MSNPKRVRLVVSRLSGWIVLGAFILLAVYVGAFRNSALGQTAADMPSHRDEFAEIDATGGYILLSWNDLGMHCYNADFRDLAVLPPYNTLWAQVVRVGDPPEIVTAGISVTYEFPDNTYSVGKSNFWDVSPYSGVQNAQWLFDLPAPLPDDVGLTGKGMSGEMELHGDHFVAEGIPLTEFRDSATMTPYPYQLATVIARDASTGVELARSTVVAPVSTEMHCDYCHSDNGVANPDIATGSVEQNILTLHDDEEMDEYPAGHTGPLMDRRPILCAECHSSNALGAPGVAEVPSLSRAMHDKHKEKVHPGLTGCYSCHPGPRTQCLRDVMAQGGMDCIDCHGDMDVVAENPNPWFNEPRCDNAACHGSGYQQDQPLYRMSQEHGGVYCAGCHDSPHAVAPSREPNDGIKFIALQGHAGPLDTCTVCHASAPTGEGPHGIVAPAQRSFTFEPDHVRMLELGEQAVYTHTLRNSGNLSDTYDLVWSSSQTWASVPSVVVGGSAVTPPVILTPGQDAHIAVTVTVPNTTNAYGLIDWTVITATSVTSLTLVERVSDTTLVSRERVYLPLILRE